MDSIALSSIIGVSATISAEKTAAHVLAEPSASRETLIIITALDEENTQRPMTIVSRTGLTELNAQSVPLKELASRLPSLISLDVDTDSLDVKTLLATADALSLSPAVPGVLVERDDQAIGTLTRENVAAALPLYLLSEDDLRVGSTPVAPTACYICRKCVPPSYRLPQTTGQHEPTCRRVWFHGPMEPA